MSATCTYYVGDALSVLRTLPDGSADLVLSSPPFLSLRDYLPRDHPDKAKEMGSEPTPGEFLDALLDVVEALARVLGPFGTLAVELGDTYAGSGGSGGDYAEGGMREGQARWQGSAAVARTTLANGTRSHTPWKGERDGFPLDKSLCLIPELFRFALAYGLNPLTGRQTPRWRVRNVVRWCRPNPPVGALGDKFRPATSDLVVACKSRTRYFDLDAVREPPKTDSDRRFRYENEQQVARPDGDSESRTWRTTNPGGAPPLDWWAIPTKGYAGSHYATFPPALLTRPILAMCPERVCTVCGEPSRRIAETNNAVGKAMGRRSWRQDPSNIGAGHTGEITGKISSAPTAERQTLGWTDCGHDSWRPGVVLDPFAGTGTTGLVATGHGRSAVLIDLDERNLHLARERIGMFLTEAPS